MLPRRSPSSCSNVVDVRRQLGDQDLLRDRVGVAGVELEQEVLDQLGRAALLDAVGHPAALAADPAAADVEDLDGDLERVLGERDHVDVGAVAEHHRLLLERALHRAEVVAQPGRLLEVLAVGGGVHLPLDPPDERPGLAGHEVAEVVDDRAVVLGGDVADARCRALVDVAEQAGPPDLAGALEDAVGAAPHREDAEQDVDGLADRPGVAVGAEVAGPLALGAATDHHPRELVADGHREPRVGLVVAVLHVEPRVELLDPGVLQLQRLDLGVDHRPVDAGGGRHHRRGAGVQVADVLEVRRQPGPQVLRLADVDHPAARVTEPVDPGLGRDRPGRGTERRGRHASTLRAGADTPAPRLGRQCRVIYSTFMPCRDPYGYALTTSPEAAPAYSRGLLDVLRLRSGALPSLAALDRARPDLRARPRRARAARPRALRRGGHPGPAPRRLAARRPRDRARAQPRARGRPRTSPATPGRWSPTSRRTRWTRCCSPRRCRRSRSPASPRCRRRRGRSSSGPSRRTATTGGSPGCWRSCARSRAASTRRWS